MNTEREEYMKRQEADHDLIRQRDPKYITLNLATVHKGRLGAVVTSEMTAIQMLTAALDMAERHIVRLETILMHNGMDVNHMELPK